MTMTAPSASSTARASVDVSLGDRSYVITIGEGLLHHAGATLRPLLARPLTAIITDENVARHHLATLKSSLDAAGIVHSELVLPAGEATKSQQYLMQVCDFILGAGIERADTVIAFGGGVIGDLVGFAAAIVRRGVNFVQIPTSLLAQVDSSVGGKTAINSPHGKNLIGAFHQPVAVLADIEVLSTLPPRELAAGYAEVVKYGLLGDADFFNWLETGANRIFSADPQARVQAIRTSCEAKARIVAADEHEHGERALLNLGHTFGHALERATGYSDTLLHGEAVSIGMAQAFRFSERLGLCPPGSANRVEAHLQSVNLPVTLAGIRQHLHSAGELIAMMRQDKKASGGKITFILVNGIGNAFIEKNVDEAHLKAFLEDELNLS